MTHADTGVTRDTATFLSEGFQGFLNPKFLRMCYFLEKTQRVDTTVFVFHAGILEIKTDQLTCRGIRAHGANYVLVGI